MRRTKIVCTLGPASWERDTLVAMVRAGMDVARLNTSHGTIGEHMEMLRRVREVAAAEGKHVAVLVDLGGPKLRTGPTPGGLPIPLETGAKVLLTPGPHTGGERAITIDYPALLTDVAPGDQVLIADGAIELEVLARRNGTLECVVRQGGAVGPQSGVNFPASALGAEPLTDRDREAVDAGVEAGADFFALSFVRKASDVAKARALINKYGADTPLIAKIERRQAIENLDEIVAEADGVMVARGDLGVELPPEEVPVQQRRIIGAAGRSMIPVITATQMLESMIDSPRPTRAEASDVANAVWDYSDAVMLSGETAIGRFPVAAVAMMDRIIRRAESEDTVSPPPVLTTGADDHSFLTGLAARRIVESDPNMRGIVCFSRSGYTAFLLSKVHAGVPVFAITASEAVARRLSLARSVIPILGPEVHTSDEMLGMVDKVLSSGYIPAGEEVVVIASLPVSGRSTTNFLKLHRVGEAAAY
jgi:pyruvate kinase